MGSAPKIPPPPEIVFPPLPEMPSFGFEMPEMPSYDPEAVERKKEAKRQEELASIIARKERGRSGTVKTGPSGLANDEDKYPVRRPGLIAR